MMEGEEKIVIETRSHLAISISMSSRIITYQMLPLSLFLLFGCLEVIRKLMAGGYRTPVVTEVAGG